MSKVDTCDKANDFINLSALGITPICDKCKKEIKEGDNVTQIFTGPVVMMIPDNELAVAESNYTVYHIDCKGN